MRKLYKYLYLYIYKMRMVTITEEEYNKLKKFETVDQELLKDIATGIKDILSGKVREV